MVRKVEFHPLANILPLIEGERFAALIADIAENGLHLPIVLFENAILDGRNRYRACCETGIEPHFKTYEGDDPRGFVRSLNSDRRDLTASQRAVIALKDEEIEAALAKERQKMGKEKIPYPLEGGQARAKAANAWGTNDHYVSDAKWISKQGARGKALLDQVWRGDINLSQALRELKKITKIEPPAIEGKYRVIYADPPWKYNDELAISKDGVGESYGPADAHYPQMSIAELCAMPVMDAAEDNAVLFFWVTAPLLKDAFQVIESWGFKYKASFVWDKIKHNMGHYNSVRHEHLLVCTRGSCLPDVSTLIDSVQSIERSEKHSEKPREFREIIDTLYPNGERIELFARTSHANWNAWGNEAA
jgi:N6-adenosine-specific RNA methylase IME4